MEDEKNLAETITSFCRFVRSEGFTAGIKESSDALGAAALMGIEDRERLKIALRAVLCSSKDEWDRFDQLFLLFWRDDQAGAGKRPLTKPNNQELAQSRQQNAATLPGNAPFGQRREDGGRAVVGAGTGDRLKKVDFSLIEPQDLDELERIALQLLKRMSLRVSRRMKSTKVGRQVDLRRTIRRNISRGGDPLDLSFKGRKMQENRLVIVLDVSGSMNPYSLFLLRFSYALQTHFRKVNTFLFSTRLTDITLMLRSRDLRQSLKAVAQGASGWSGGTRIGESLHEFNFFHARRLLSRDTVFIILSDGWDTGEPEVLAGELAAIHQRVSKVIWLNPLLGLKEYQPVTRGISAALPYIDVFAPGHNLESLLQLEGHLSHG